MKTDIKKAGGNPKGERYNFIVDTLRGTAQLAQHKNSKKF